MIYLHQHQKEISLVLQLNLDFDKLKNVPAESSQPSNEVKSDVVKKTVYNKLVIKDSPAYSDISITSVFLLLKHSMIETNKVLRRKLKMLTQRYLILMGQSRRLVTTQKLQRLKKKTPTITGLVNTAALNATARVIENEISDTIMLIRKTDCNTKIP